MDEAMAVYRKTAGQALTKCMILGLLCSRTAVQHQYGCGKGNANVHAGGQPFSASMEYVYKKHAEAATACAMAEAAADLYEAQS